MIPGVRVLNRGRYNSIVFYQSASNHLGEVAPIQAAPPLSLDTTHITLRIRSPFFAGTALHNTPTLGDSLCVSGWCADPFHCVCSWMCRNSSATTRGSATDTMLVKHDPSTQVHKSCAQGSLDPDTSHNQNPQMQSRLLECSSSRREGWKDAGG